MKIDQHVKSLLPARIMRSAAVLLLGAAVLVFPSDAFVLLLGAAVLVFPSEVVARRIVLAPTKNVDYANHGTDWHMGSCSSRLLQSPINIDSLLGDAERVQNSFGYSHPPTKGLAKFFWDGSSLTADLSEFGKTNFVEFRGVEYGINVARWRAQSEHMLRGKRFPLELQLEHVARTRLAEDG